MARREKEQDKRKLVDAQKKMGRSQDKLAEALKEAQSAMKDVADYWRSSGDSTAKATIASIGNVRKALLEANKKTNVARKSIGRL